MTPEDAKQVMEIMCGIERLAEDSRVLFHNRVFDPLRKMSFAAFINVATEVEVNALRRYMRLFSTRAALFTRLERPGVWSLNDHGEFSMSASAYFAYCGRLVGVMDDLAQVCNSPSECLAHEIGEQTVFDAKAWAATWVLTARAGIDALEKKWGERKYE